MAGTIRRRDFVGGVVKTGSPSSIVFV